MFYFKGLVSGLALSGLLLVGNSVYVALWDVVVPEDQEVFSGRTANEPTLPLIAVEAPYALSLAISHPLFRPDRRPFSVPLPALVPEPPPLLAPELSDAPPVQVDAPPAPAPPPQFPHIVLHGIHRTGQVDAALIENVENPQGSWKHIGDLVEGWMIKSITDDGVAFIFEKEVQVVKLHVDNLANEIGNTIPPP